MGGMIVQMMAIEHPDRIASLTSIMSSTGNPRSGAPTPEAREALLAPPPTERAAFIEASTRAEVWASKRYLDHDRMRERAAADFDRAFYPEGATRQLAAIYATGDRSDRLRTLDAPHARDPRSRRHADHPVGRGGHRTAGRRLPVPPARRHGPRSPRPALARCSPKRSVATSVSPRPPDAGIARRLGRSWSSHRPHPQHPLTLAQHPLNTRRRPTMAGPLAGYRIIEIAGIGPGPFAAMLLADLGAEVIRVERAGAVRGPAPDQPHGDVLLRGRRNIAIDLKHPDGVATLLDLVERRRCADRGVPARRDGTARCRARRVSRPQPEARVRTDDRVGPDRPLQPGGRARHQLHLARRRARALRSPRRGTDAAAQHGRRLRWGRHVPRPRRRGRTARGARAAARGRSSTRRWSTARRC